MFLKPRVATSFSIIKDLKSLMMEKEVVTLGSRNICGIIIIRLGMHGQ
jgi:hypothetical protein